MTSPAERLTEAAKRIQGGQLAQQKHAKEVAASLPARPPATPPEQPAPAEGQPAP